MKTKSSARPSLTGFTAGLALLGSLALFGCNRQDTTAPAVTTTTPDTSAQPAAAQPATAQTVAGDDDYVYYPQYEVYFSPHRHQYYYREGGRWAWRREPNHVAVNVLMSSPSVHMDFRDAPDRHHDEIMRRYPRNWHPDDRHDDRKH